MANPLGPLARDLRHALRALRRRKAFGLTAVASLALGIGAASALFSVVDAVLLQPVALPEADRLIVLAESRNGEPVGSTPQRLFDYAERMPTLSRHCATGIDTAVDVGFPTVSLPVQHALWTGRTQQQSGVSTGSGVLSSFQYIETGILLTVTPRINSGVRG